MSEDKVYMMSNASFFKNVTEDVAPTLTEGDSHNAPMVAYQMSKSGFIGGVAENKANPLLGSDAHEPPIVAAEKVYTLGHGDFHTRAVENKCGTLTAHDYIDPPTVNRGMRVRRLTPKECGRLQGFPDDWCEGVEGGDSAQYKMWGNGVALPCVLYIMEGIKEEGDKLGL